MRATAGQRIELAVPTRCRHSKEGCGRWISPTPAVGSIGRPKVHQLRPRSLDFNGGNRERPATRLAQRLSGRAAKHRCWPDHGTDDWNAQDHLTWKCCEEVGSSRRNFKEMALACCQIDRRFARAGPARQFHSQDMLARGSVSYEILVDPDCTQGYAINLHDRRTRCCERKVPGRPLGRCSIDRQPRAQRRYRFPIHRMIRIREMMFRARRRACSKQQEQRAHRGFARSGKVPLDSPM